MNPRLTLQMWRERWDKADEGLALKPYVGGKVYDWTKKVPYASAWQRPGVAPITMLLCALFLALVCHISFPMNGQITFAGFMIATGMYLRRFVGPLFTLMLICLCIMCSMQYFSWRLGQTIIDQTDAAFVWAFLLGSIEVCVVFYLFVGWVRHLLPLSEIEAAFNLDEADLPTVDVFILCTDIDTESALNQIRACAAINWPAKKLALHISDAGKRAQISTIARDLDASYIEELTPNIATGAGEFIVLLDLKQSKVSALPQDFLKRTLGWFNQDESLAFLYHADHFLAPKICASVLKMEQTAIQLSEHGVAVLRRAALPSESEQSLKTFRHRTWSRSALLIQQTASTTTAQASYKKINNAHSEKIIRAKQRLGKLHEMLGFYAPLAIAIYLISPLAYLLWGIQLIQAPLEWWLVMALPCAALIAMTEARCQNEYRLGTLREIKELLLATYFLIPTSYSFLKTKLSRPAFAMTKFNADQNLHRFTHDSLTYLLFWANAIGLCAGIWGLQFATQHNIGWRVFYCTWALLNALILLSRKAINHEASEVQWFASQQGKLSGAVRLAFGRLLVCETLNFPSLTMVIATPIKLESKVDSPIHLTLYHLNHAYTLQAKVKKIDGLTTTLQINPDANQDYQSLKDVVFARSATWPAWLPHKNADRPLPAWIYRAMHSIPLKTLDFMTNLTSFLNWDAFLKLWKK
jgi:cellulose synthase (UDP-forming)